MRRHLLSAAAATAIAAVSSCTVADLDLSGKHCPCAAGWSCDTARNVCVFVAAGGDGGAPGNDGGGGPGDGGDDGGPGAAAIKGFHAAWATPDSIRWVWPDQPETYASWQIVTADSESDLRTLGQTSRVWNASTSPELGVAQTRASSTNGHKPATTSWAQLAGIDAAGTRRTSDVVSFTTEVDPKNEFVIFNEADMPGTSLPATFVRAGTQGGGGGFNNSDFWYEDTVDCTPDPSPCVVALKRQKLLVTMPDIPDAAFGGAFVELAVAGSGTTPALDGDFNVIVGDNPCGNVANGCRWHASFVIRGGGAFILIQFPLSQMTRSDGTTLTSTELRYQSGLLREIGLGGTLKNGALLRVDDIRIRW